MFTNKRITIMGLGVHGGGRAAINYFLSQGDRITVTDLQGLADLQPSLAGLIYKLDCSPAELAGGEIRCVLGRHDMSDFTNTDILIKNPAVKPNSPYLRSAEQAGTRIETDISIFLSELQKLAEESAEPNSITLIAITGTKGKSSNSATVHHVLSTLNSQQGSRQDGQRFKMGKHCFLGGNITRSPLSFLDELRDAVESGKHVFITLELSSFQIGDLRLVLESRKRLGISDQLYWPNYAMLTNILPDHQDYYKSMDAYVADKLFLFQAMPEDSVKFIGNAGNWTRDFLAPSSSRQLKSSPSDTVHGYPVTAGGHSSATHGYPAAAELLGEIGKNFGWSVEDIGAAVDSFPGLEHRFQRLGYWNLQTTEDAESEKFSVLIINDSAATIPDATLRSVGMLKGSAIYLICGGSDKGLSLNPLVEACEYCTRIYLFEGKASNRLVEQSRSISNKLSGKNSGMYSSMDEVIKQVYADICSDYVNVKQDQAESSQNKVPHKTKYKAVVLLSPGCASFGLFRNEFDRGKQFIALVEQFPRFVRGYL